MIWNMKQPKEGIYSVVRFIHFIARMFGFWPFYIGNQPIGKSERILMTIWTTFWYIWATIIILLHLASIYLKIEFRTALPLETMTIALSVEWINSATFTSIMILPAVLDVINRNRIRGIIAKFDEFDLQV